jgi:hypothetical protein
MTVQNTHRSYIGIAKESTKGTVVAPTSFIPVAVGKLKPVDIIDPLYDVGLRGSLVKNYNYIQGRTRSTFGFGGPVFPDTVGFGIAGLLGSVATTGSSAPYTHVVSLKNATAVGADAQPGSFTLTDFYAANVRSYSGCQISEFGLTFSPEGLLEYDVKATGFKSTVVSTPTPSFSTILPTPVWQATVSIAGSPVSNTIDGSLTMTRPVTPIYGLSGSQDPYQIFVGALETKGTFKFVMENDDQLVRFLTNTQPSITLNWTNGSGSTETQLQVTLTKGAYTAVTIERGKDYVEVNVTVEAMANTTDAGSTGGFAPVKWTLKNALPSGTYQ